MSVSAISSLPTLQPLVAKPPVAAPAESGFAEAVSNAVEKLDGAHAKADGLAVQAASGTLTDVHDYMIAATQAQVATELTVAVRNKAVEAFNDIMRMQI
jgi:flagellar hook-basal body complex protein FliE